MNVFQKWRYLVLLGSLLALLVIQPLISVLGIMSSLFDALFVLVMAVLGLAVAQDKFWRLAACLLLIPAAALSIGGQFLPTAGRDLALLAGHAIGACFFVIVVGKIVQSIFATRELTWDSIFNAICGYLLLGVAWGLLYVTMYAMNSESFQLGNAIGSRFESGEYSRHVFMYYSFVSLTTVGFGDVTPVSIPARTLSWVEAVTGQLYLAVVIAGLIGALVARNAATAGESDTVSK